MSNNTNHEIVAVVSPRSVGGTALFAATEPITAENVQQFHSEADVVRDASNELKKLGFKVLQESPTTISFSGSRQLFEQFFGTNLEQQKREVSAGQEMEFFAVSGKPEQQLLQAPGELSNLFEGVALAEPPILFESPLPPLVKPHPDAYRYLLVPDEVAVVLRAARVHRNGTTGKGIKVAMVDTGFYRHKFYSYHGYRVASTVLGPGTSDPTEDTHGHGTGEAANIFAVAPDVQLIPVKMSDTVGAFNAAVAQSPHVISNSWGYDIDKPGVSLTPYLKALEAAVANAVANGIVVCFSAGNGHYGFPGSMPDVIAVGGVHLNYPKLDLEASNYASSFDSSLYLGRHVPDVCGLTGKQAKIGDRFFAPSIMLPVQPGSSLDGIAPSTGSSSDGWGLFSGTSAACPQVAGVVALLLEKEPTRTPAQVKALLMKSARDVKKGTSSMGERAGAGPDAATGAGLVDAKWAWLITMGEVVADFFEASAEKQAEILEARQLPRITKALIADVMDTLHSR